MNMENLQISLPSDMVELVRAKVAAGGFTSSSEVIREALKVWQSDEARHEERLATIRRKIAEAEADPRPSLTEEEMDQHFEALFKEHE